jgi:hypothetical protein
MGKDELIETTRPKPMPGRAPAAGVRVSGAHAVQHEYNGEKNSHAQRDYSRGMPPIVMLRERHASSFGSGSGSGFHGRRFRKFIVSIWYEPKVGAIAKLLPFDRSCAELPFR